MQAGTSEVSEPAPSWSPGVSGGWGSSGSAASNKTVRKQDTFGSATTAGLDWGAPSSGASSSSAWGASTDMSELDALLSKRDDKSSKAKPEHQPAHKPSKKEKASSKPFDSSAPSLPEFDPYYIYAIPVLLLI